MEKEKNIIEKLNKFVLKLDNYNRIVDKNGVEWILIVDYKKDLSEIIISLFIDDEDRQQLDIEDIIKYTLENVLPVVKEELGISDSEYAIVYKELVEGSHYISLDFVAFKRKNDFQAPF